MSSQVPAELQLLADGISWGTCGTNSVAALKVQVLPLVSHSVPQRLSASAYPSDTSCQIGPCGSCGCIRYPLNTPEAAGWLGLRWQCSSAPVRRSARLLEANCYLQITLNSSQMKGKSKQK